MYEGFHMKPLAFLILFASLLPAADKPKGVVTAAVWPANHKRTVARVLTYPFRHPVKTLRHLPPFGF